MKKQERKLKVGYKCQDRPFSKMVVVPEIKLCGKWLKELNFHEGMEVKIKVQNKKLVITPIESQMVAEPTTKYKSKKK